jgi:hypothetical protein
MIIAFISRDTNTFVTLMKVGIFDIPFITVTRQEAAN